MVRKELVLLSLCLATGYQMSYEDGSRIFPWPVSCRPVMSCIFIIGQAGDLFENNVKDDEFGKVVSISGVLETI